MTLTTVQGLKNVFSAREFVGWYNGHPDFVSLPVDLSKVRTRQLCLDCPGSSSETCLSASACQLDLTCLPSARQEHKRHVPAVLAGHELVLSAVSCRI